jgi:hypothetical protein
MPENKELAAALKLAKTTPMFFAFATEGTTENGLIVAKKKNPPHKNCRRQEGGQRSGPSR